MFYVYSGARKVGAIVPLADRQFSLSFNRVLRGQFRDYCGSRENTWKYLQSIFPDVNVRNVGDVREVLMSFIERKNHEQENDEDC